MPWDRSAVVVTPLELSVDPSTGMVRLIASGPSWKVEAGDDVSVGQPAWQRDGRLRFVSDRHGWWQPYCHSGRARRRARRGTDRGGGGVPRA